MRHITVTDPETAAQAATLRLLHVPWHERKDMIQEALIAAWRAGEAFDAKGLLEFPGRTGRAGYMTLAANRAARAWLAREAKAPRPVAKEVVEKRAPSRDPYRVLEKRLVLQAVLREVRIVWGGGTHYRVAVAVLKKKQDHVRGLSRRQFSRVVHELEAYFRARSPRYNGDL